MVATVPPKIVSGMIRPLQCLITLKFFTTLSASTVSTTGYRQ